MASPAQNPLNANSGLFAENLEQKAFNSGVRMVSIKSDNKQIFLASRRNNFGGIDYKKVKIDGGADSVLLYFLNMQSIIDIGNKFANDVYRFSLCRGNAISSTIPILKIAHSANKPFKISLCTDILPNNKPFSTRELMFAVCLEDCDQMFRNKQLAHVNAKLQQTNSSDLLKLWANSNYVTPRRRTHVLVGQSLLDPLSIHQHQGLEVAYDYDFSFVGDYDLLCLRIKDQLQASQATGEVAEFFTELAVEPNNDLALDPNVAYGMQPVLLFPAYCVLFFLLECRQPCSRCIQHDRAPC